MFADGLSKLWGKPVVVENRPGGDGLVSLSAFAQAKDDHVLWFGPAGAFTALPYMHDTLPFDPSPDMNPIVSISVVVLAVSDAGIDEHRHGRSARGAGAVGAGQAQRRGGQRHLGFPAVRVLQEAGPAGRRTCRTATSCRRRAISSEGRIQVLSSSLAVPQAAGQCRPAQDSGGDQQAARAEPAQTYRPRSKPAIRT